MRALLIGVLACAVAQDAEATCAPGPEIDFVVDARTGDARELFQGHGVFLDAAMRCPLGNPTAQQVAALPAARTTVGHATLGSLILRTTLDKDVTTLHAFDAASARRAWSIASAAGFGSAGWNGCHDLGEGLLGVDTTSGLRVIDARTGKDIMTVAIDTSRGLQLVRAGSRWIVQGTAEVVAVDEGGTELWRRALPANAGPAAIVGATVMLVASAQTGFDLVAFELASGKERRVHVKHSAETLRRLWHGGPGRLAATPSGHVRIAIPSMFCVAP
jgi:hypothetical protein